MLIGLWSSCEKSGEKIENKTEKNTNEDSLFVVPADAPKRVGDRHRS